VPIGADLADSDHVGANSDDRNERRFVDDMVCPFGEMGDG